MTTQTLSQIPDARRLFLKAATTIGRRPKGQPKLPALEVEVKDVGVDASHLASYAEVCGFANTERLPITFPHVMAGALHLHLLTQKTFPFPLLGLVHVRNEIRQQRALRPDERFDLRVRVGESRAVRQGIEFDLLTDLSIGEAPVWTEVSTILHRVPTPKAAPAPRPAPAPSALSDYRSFTAAADIGRRYAPVGHDFNPIHLTPLAARLFGFKRHIAHGMWSLAHCAALLEAELPQAPRELAVQFKQPLFLPGRVTLKFRRGGDGIEFALLASRADKVHLTGSLR
ncbi:MaoC/PaaZ C-terminal domain-containing protein [Fontimonas sp. SYSU GA230001]|uniref:MaoC family dehydratase n=1 Tax=Fontimonas sp. SYSU GA230001 TaxID=3142450 RepID=UPI0032B3B2E7